MPVLAQASSEAVARLCVRVLVTVAGSWSAWRVGYSG
jgi:hypothetical protein